MLSDSGFDFSTRNNFTNFRFFAQVTIPVFLALIEGLQDDSEACKNSSIRAQTFIA